MASIRVTLADDHPIVLAGLGMLVRSERDFELVGEATSGPDARAMIRDLLPDIAVIDVSLPSINGIQLARELGAECPSVRFIVLTQHEDRAYLRQALDAGVKGYVLKKSTSVCLVNAIRGVLVGGLYVDPAMTRHLYRAAQTSNKREPAGGARELTQREEEVMKLFATGLTAKAIAAHLDLSLSTVETYKTRGLDKIGITNRADIVRFASAKGWLAGI
ncbi:MAG: response regulator transcription factor [Afipia sp.]|nr:response regulator transcription factor [Afipia sp.]